MSERIGIWTAIMTTILTFLMTGLMLFEIVTANESKGLLMVNLYAIFAAVMLISTAIIFYITWNAHNKKDIQLKEDIRYLLDIYEVTALKNKVEIGYINKLDANVSVADKRNIQFKDDKLIEILNRYNKPDSGKEKVINKDE